MFLPARLHDFHAIFKNPFDLLIQYLKVVSGGLHAFTRLSYILAKYSKWQHTFYSTHYKHSPYYREPSDLPGDYRLIDIKLFHRNNSVIQVESCEILISAC